MSTTTDAGTLQGKVALVTGGSRGIGAAIAKRLAREGAAVALTYSATPDGAAATVKDIEAAGGKARAIHADARDSAAVEAAVEETVATYGQLDILVNAAGVFLYKSVQETTLDDFDWAVDINVKGLFVATKAAVKHLREGGRIVNIGSINADYIPYVGGGLYAMTKAAVAGLTKALSRDLGPLGITVNNVQPGPTNTDMNPDEGDAGALTRSRTALGRFAHPDEIADFVVYVASPGASFITGASLSIDGGYTA
ncbi:oxidoreductase [Mycobacterium sp. MS1601]|uniref:SDR family NAD(P)-dependent oxidoreductase n=1 Tax=Mycobacterium sp. MS1601 TaxID=1936029 RepID=UPI0009791FB9|nr:3-oxoacyl-ACP reductase family protein [Mycobacterium sp. MS1601]AQA02758.1 oxidoreductase [Mycobacterium sp. MS1601]